MYNRKTKSLYNIIIDECRFITRLWYNPNTDYIGINTSYQYRKDEGKEYYKNNKDKINTRMKIYRKIHREKIKINSKIYYNNHSQIIFLGKHTKSNLPKVKPGYVYHHYIYDHLNTSDYVIEMTRGEHSKLHLKMRRENIEIPHINVRVNDIHGF